MTPDRRSPAPDPAREVFLGQLRDALRLEAQRSGVRPGPALLRAELIQPASRHRVGGRTAVAFAVAAVLVVGAIVLALPEDGSQPLGGNATSTATRPFVTTPASPASPAPVTLADCQIYPEDASLAFSGWATTTVLHATGGDAQPGQPVYALVTRGQAEWMGWRTTGAGAIFPPPVGRMGCIFDPSTGGFSLIGVPMDWQPPAIVDGCPASPEDEFAGYREIGGPRAWALLPTGPSGWVAGQDAVILFRLSPPLGGGQVLTAWAVPLAGGHREDGSVSTVSSDVQPVGAAATPEPAAFRYYVVQQPFPTPGCWVLNVAVDGQLAGSVITSVAAP